MCGIAGVISKQPGAVQQVQQMITCLSHRGPDGDGCWQSEDGLATLGHRRLAIIDLSPAAAQPMHYRHRYTIVHNGEIYNYKELRQALQQQGYSFDNNSDTEVILAAYDRWGTECLQQFDGMFAFAIWDSETKTLFVARDRFGEKPLYYQYDRANARLVFASELKALKKTCNCSVNHTMLLNYLGNGISFVADAGATFYEDIFKVPARHYLYFDHHSNTLEITPWFDIDISAQDRDEAAAIAGFAALFNDAVKRRLRSDVEIGTSLSGGIDSASVVAAIHGMKGDGLVHQAFTVGFPGFEKDETTNAALVAKQFGLQHHVVTPSANDLVNELDRFLDAHDEPVSSSSVFAQYILYRLAAQHGVKVMLDGQGADEILAGYTRYYRWFLLQQQRGHASALPDQMKALNYQLTFKDKLAAWFPGWAAIRLEARAVRNQKQAMFNRAYVSENLDKHSVYKPIVRNLNDVLYFDVFRGPLEELLRNADRNAMAHGVEVRLPFLEAALVQFAFSLPASMKIREGNTKYVLRKAMEHKLPSSIVWNREKIGFEPPQQQWMSSPQLQERIRAARSVLVQHRVLHPSVIDQPVMAHGAHDADNYDWRFLCAAHWL